MELVLTAFITGLFSGVHCAAMCGGIVSALNLPAGRDRIVIQPDSSGALRSSIEAFPIHLAYSGGRVASYMIAGGVAGGIGGTALLAQSALPMQMILSVFANLMLLLLALYLSGYGHLLAQIEKLGVPLWKRIAPLVKSFLPADTPARAFGVGMAWGWLPCGLVYSMLALALMSGGPASGAMVMAAFGLGTLPNLIVAGLAIKQLRPFLARSWVRQLAATVIFSLGLLGLIRIPQVAAAIQTGILCFS